LFEQVMGVNPSYYQTGSTGGEVRAKRPVERVSWYDALAFCNKLSLLEGRKPVYSVTVAGKEVDWANLAYADIPVPTRGNGNSNWDNAVKRVDMNGYRLPYEMEWMWAAMGGKEGGVNVTNTGYQKAFAGHDGTNAIGDYAWYGNSNNAVGRTHEVGKKRPNELGLYDMTGNVAEWCWEPEGSTLMARHSTPADPAKMFRGGAWSYSAALCTLGSRGEESHDHPSQRFSYVGLRLVRER
jgi:formylglycine-generating enzyme required for sulfatase activity